MLTFRKSPIICTLFVKNRLMYISLLLSILNTYRKTHAPYNWSISHLYLSQIQSLATQLKKDQVNFSMK